MAKRMQPLPFDSTSELPYNKQLHKENKKKLVMGRYRTNGIGTVSVFLAPDTAVSVSVSVFR